MAPTTRILSREEQFAFTRDGFLVVGGLASPKTCAGLLEVIESELRDQRGAIEYEADLGYEGAPSSRQSAGGKTIRRLRQACDRHPLFASWAADPRLLGCLAQLLGPELVLPLAHHNCVMTKQPQFSSRTAWHQDFRYWSFQRPELISAWLALGPETADNGALEIVPGSHALKLDSDRFDQQAFFRNDLPENRELLENRRMVTLEPGDVLLFHCLALHAAGPNRTDDTKYSVVFTYRPEDNPPSAGSRSASGGELSEFPSSAASTESPEATETPEDRS